MRTARTRIGLVFSVSVAVAASLAGTAGAGLPDGKVGGPARAQPELSFNDFNLGVYLPASSGLNSIDGWISRQMTSRASARGAEFAGPVAVARAIARRSR